MKRIIFLLAIMLFALPCAAQQPASTTQNATTYYKAANETGYPMIHSRKDCPFLEGEQVAPVKQEEFSGGKYHFCFTCTSSSGATKNGSLYFQERESDSKSKTTPKLASPTSTLKYDANTSSKSYSSEPTYRYNTNDTYTAPSSGRSNYTVYTGPRGGRYHYSRNGKKVYERKKKY